MTEPVLSLKRRLQFWLLVPLGMMAAALVTEAYLSARESAESIHDNRLVTIAISISEFVIGSAGDLVPDEVLGLMSSTSDERTYYLVTGPDRSFITGYSDLPLNPDDKALKGGVPTFYDAKYVGSDVRVVALTFLVEGREIDGWMAVHVAQTRELRNELVLEAVARSTIRIAIVIGLASLFAWVGISRGLEPLNKLQDAIRRRSYDDLRPIKHQMPSEVRHVVLSLNQLLERLTLSINSSQQFIADASHQLRTPLSALQAKTELALRGAERPEDKELLQSLHQGTQQTSRLANQLLSLARTRPESGGDVLMTELDLNKIAADVTEEWVRRALDRGADLGFEGADSPLLIVGNETLVRELLANLIDNALRYGSDEPRITVRLKLSGDETVVLDVEDDGPGIPDEFKCRAFDRFARLDESDGDGCGLGLAIVREIAERHGGNANLLESEGGGLLVRVSFPLSAAPG